MAWLGSWQNRRKITIDNTNIDSDLTHFPVPVVLGTSVGQSSQDVSDIFDELGSESLKIAITKEDGTTQLHGEIEQWDDTAEKAVIWVSKSDLVLTTAATTELYIYFDSTQADNLRFIGGTAEANTVTDVSGDAFTGNDDDLPDPSLWSVRGGTPTIQSNKLAVAAGDAILSNFKLNGDFDAQIDFENNVAPSTHSWNLEFKCAIDGDNWLAIARTYTYTVCGSPGHAYTVIRKVAGNGAEHACFTTSDASGKIRITRSGSNFQAYYWSGSSWTALGSAVTIGTGDTGVDAACNNWDTSPAVDGFFDNFVINSGTVKYTPSYLVYDGDFTEVKHMAQDPSGGADAIKDSTDNNKDGTSAGSMLTEDLIDGGIGKAIDFDGTDDYISTSDPITALDDFTIECVAYLSGTSLQGAFLSVGSLSDAAKGYSIGVGDSTMDAAGNNLTGLADGASWIPTTRAMGTGWVTTALQRISNTWYTTLDGVRIATAITTAPLAPTTATVIGANHPTHASARRWFAGGVSEIRISDTVRSAAWLKATHYTLIDDILIFDATETPDITVDMGTAEITMSASMDDPTLDITVDMGTAEITMSASMDDPAAALIVVLPTAEITMSASMDDPAVDITVVLPTAEITMSAQVGIKETADMPAAEITMSACLDDPLLNIIVVLPTAEITMSGSMDVVAFSQALADVYYIFTLTGAADGLADIEVPMTSFQTRMRNGDPSFLSVILPDSTQAAAINARSNGTLLVDMAYKLDGVFIQRETIVSADLESIRADEGGSSSPITLSGHKTESYPGNAITLTTSIYRNIIDGKIRHRLAEPNINLRPGDTVTIGSDTFVVGLMTYYISVASKTMEIAEEA